MPIGGLRHRVAIEAPVEVPVPGGGVTTSWTETAKVWARIVTLSGGEGFHALQLNPELTHKVTIRYRRGLTSSHRLRFGTRMFQIKSIDNRDQRDRWLDMMCIEGVPA